MKRFWFAFVLAAVLGSGCASRRPTPLIPGTEPLYYAEQATIAIGTLQSSAIALNGIQVCAEIVPPATAPVCHPLVSDANTRIVIDGARDGILTIRATPGGWKAIANAALDRVDARLDAAGKQQLRAYTAGARAVIALIGVPQ